ncbi:MAG: tRNA (adenosine(37)-N6)-threonylcarbamoyltransferase complex ATPase subunit type 1 TsaE [Sphaerobacter sp.]|nr:tRNA (adenosine(37)-N6)-threonylcarbamoyltransferase complex ATPase subunit type 1 TsaE [Sphaerobacter sp.]
MATQRPALDVISHSPEQTRSLGARLGRLARAGDVFLLTGQIGSGKTTFAQGLARGLGVASYVQSPTFTLVSEHSGHTADGRPVTLYHLDLYRLESADDLVTFGYADYFADPAAITVVEWPERLGADLPDEYLLISFDHLADSKRRLALYPRGKRPEALIDAFRTEVFGARRGSAASGN